MDVFYLIWIFLKFILYYYILIFSIYLIRIKLNNNNNKSIMIILGSGGHTGELLLMLSKLDFNKFKKCFIISSHNDKNSENKFKEIFDLKKYSKTSFQFIKIYRARNVGQSFLTSIFTTFYSMIQSFFVMIKTQPNICVTNGPGVAIPIVYIGFILKKMMILIEFKILFIESFCRTKSISLSGKLIKPICDKFIVLWENLKGNNKEFIGKIL
jgi:beta-1,4-N-acetylglucosaminyltransferase